MAYSRLLRAYYHFEAPIPQGQQYRLARATTPAQRKAVDSVLAEFFTLTDGCYRQHRADREIAAYLEGEPEREVKKANESLRLKRHRDERAQLFKVLTECGQHAAWNVPMAELRELAKRCSSRSPETPPATAPETLPATETATPATATQTPYPDTIPRSREEGSNDPPSPPRAIQTVAGTVAGRLCGQLKLAGMPRVNPHNPRLLSLLEAGATEAEFLAMVPKALPMSDPFAYLLSAVEGERTRAAKTSPELHRGAMPTPAEPAWRSEQRERNEQFLGPAAASRRAATIATSENPDAPAVRLG